MMKVFLFIVEDLIIKHRKEIIDVNQAKRYDEALVNVYHYWNKMYLYSRREQFSESELEIFEV
jgi:hypothetical protein